MAHLVLTPMPCLHTHRGHQGSQRIESPKSKCRQGYLHFTNIHIITSANTCFLPKISLLHMYTSLNYTHPFKYIRMRTHTNTKTHHTNIHASTMCNQTFSPWKTKAMIFFSLFTLNVDTIFLQRYMYVQYI